MNPSNIPPPDPGSGQPHDPAATGSSQSGTGGHLKEVARDKAQQLKEAANQTARQAKERTAQVVGERREQAADRIGGYSSAVRESARSLEEQDPNIAWFANQAADRIQGLADYVRSRDFNGLRADAEDFGRRHPALVLSGLLLAGFVVGSAIKAGRSATQDTDQPEQSDSDYAYDPETSPPEGMTSPVSPIPGSSEI